MELLVRIVDRTPRNSDPAIDSKLSVAGDVVVYKPDGSEWGLRELDNPEWRIIRVVGMTEEEAIALVSPELPPTLDKHYPLLQSRAMKLDLSKLSRILVSRKNKSHARTADELKIVAVDTEIDIINVRNAAVLKEPLIEK